VKRKTRSRRERKRELRKRKKVYSVERGIEAQKREVISEDK